MQKKEASAIKKPSLADLPSEWLFPMVFLALYWLAGRIGLLFVLQPEGLASIWPASGLALATLLLAGEKSRTRYVAAIFAGNLLANITGGNSLLTSLGFSAANTAEPLLGWWTFTRIAGRPAGFGKIKELWGFAAAALFANGLTAFLGAAVPALAFGAPYWSTWEVWWVADGLGIIVIAPPILAWAERTREGLPRPTPRRWIEGAAIVLMVVAISLHILKLAPVQLPIADMPYALFPLVIWMAIRFEVRGSSVVMLCISGLFLADAMNPSGASLWGEPSMPLHRLMETQLYLAILGMVSLFAAASTSSLRNSERLLEREKRTLQESESKYRSLFNNAELGMFRTRMDGSEILDANEKLLELFGLTREEMEHTPSTLYWNRPEEREAMVRRLNEEGRVVDFPCTMLNKKGEKRLCLASLRLFPDERILEGSLLDITELKKAEEALREITQRLHLAMASAKAGVWDWNIRTNEMIWDDRMLELYGLTRENFPGGVEAWEQGLHPEDAPGAIEESQAALRGERDYDTEFRVRHPDGRVLHIKANALVLRDEAGSPLRMIGLNTDITDRKRTEEEYRHMEELLSQAQKMEAIGTLAGGIAHDFNNILAAILGYAEMALDENQPENRQHDLHEIIKGAERAKALVRQILTFSRQESHEKRPLAIKPLLKEAIQFLQASLPATIEIRDHLTEERCTILADPTQMHQILMNLSANAAYAMKRTGGVLRIDLSNVELAKGEMARHPDLRPGPYLKLTVSDTGQGIDPAHIHRIFDPFFTTKSKDEGTGLGLSVVFGIVKGHDGIIDVQSEPGRGARFSVYLPRIPQEESAGGNRSGTFAGGTEQILFVDDESALVEMGRRMLSSLGYRVTGVNGSIEALELFRAAPGRFDLIITDMTLPKMTGIELSREILRIRPETPIILCSGIRESDTEEQVRSLGIRAYCTKPLLKRELAQVIRNTLDGDENAPSSEIR